MYPAGRRATGSSPRQTRQSRAWGQNFLVQPAVAEKIVSAAALKPGDEVVEIGPGKGALTECLTRRALSRLLLVEIDPELAELARRRFGAGPRVEVAAADFLQLDLASVLGRPPVKLVGNLPFSSAAAILRRVSARPELITRMVLMFQKEVAARVRARPGDAGYAALSVFCALWWQIIDHFAVGAGNFWPRPRVDAEVLVMEPRPPESWAAGRRALIEGVVSGAFFLRRKLLRNSLAAYYGAAPAAVERALELAELPARGRAQELARADFLRLAAAVERVGLA
jgi:16S rRNA (adenine1518-N6/adenine1519-N6)-dimethyltransferase